jgi:hypothetical protein
MPVILCSSVLRLVVVDEVRIPPGIIGTKGLLQKLFCSSAKIRGNAATELDVGALRSSRPRGDGRSVGFGTRTFRTTAAISSEPSGHPASLGGSILAPSAPRSRERRLGADEPLKPGHRARDGQHY